MSDFSSCEWSDSNILDETENSCSWSDTDNVEQTCSWSSDSAPQQSPSKFQDECSKDWSSPVSLLDSNISEASWTPPPTPVKRCSPRVPKAKRYLYTEEGHIPNSHFTAEKWNLFKVMEISGCEDNCTTRIHGLMEYDVLRAHSMFTSLSNAEQRQWVYDYLSNHCPNSQSGTSDPTGLKFILCGKNVCQPLWLATLALSTSRFYELRKLFLEDSGPPANKKARSFLSKSLEAVSWMTNYFNK